MDSMRVWPLGLAALALAPGARAAPGVGTDADPIVVDALPYALASTTASAPSSVIDSYDCAPNLDESGPERIFRFSLDTPARVSAWIEESGTVDVDVHLLDDWVLSGTEATGCVSRGNVIAEAEMSAGTHFLVVDTYAGNEQAGDFVMHLDAIGDAWQERIVAQGVRWRARRSQDLKGGPQVVHVLSVDLATPGLRIEAHPSNGCQTVSELGRALGAQAGVNGGYFNTSTCAPVSLLKHAGQLVGTNGTTRGAFGIDANGAPLIEIVPSGADWPAASEAHGGGPILASAGTPTSDSDWASEGFANAGFNGVNPRTWAGIDGSGNVLLGTVDGRRANAQGMSLGSLGSYVSSGEVGALDAVNLDGGGSSQMWIDGATPNGVVNYPSDNASAEEPTHAGSRACSGGWFLFAPPENHAPRFQTTAPTDAAVGSPYSYDADALDLDVLDVLTFSLGVAPAGMTVDATSGVVSYAPDAQAPANAAVTLVVSDDHGASTEQSFTLTVAGGVIAPPDGGAGTGGSAGGTDVDSGAGLAPSASEDGSSVDGGCGCRSVGHRAGGGGLLAAAFIAMVLKRRRLRRATLPRRTAKKFSRSRA
jgi:Phosphodiester glycosidase/Putative Ig domain